MGGEHGKSDGLKKIQSSDTVSTIKSLKLNVYFKQMCPAPNCLPPFYRNGKYV